MIDTPMPGRAETNRKLLSAPAPNWPGIRTKRVYDTPTLNDGVRVLVERLWPRGMKKGDLHLGVPSSGPGGRDPVARGAMQREAGDRERMLFAGEPPAIVEGWDKDAAPSDGLRRWFHHDPKKWKAFRERYFTELDRNPGAWEPLLAAARRGPVTLLYSAKDTVHNNAVALKAYLDSKLPVR